MGYSGPRVHAAMARRFSPILLLALTLPIGVQLPAFSQDEIPRYATPQNAPCMDQPRSLAEMAASFRYGKLPLVSEMTGTWVEIGDVWSHGKNSLNCSGIRRGSKFEFVIVADGYSVALHAIGMMPPLNVKIGRDNEGSVAFPVNFGADEGPDHNRCRLTDRGTLVCLVAEYRGEEFKRMKVQTDEIYETTQN